MDKRGHVMALEGWQTYRGGQIRRASLLCSPASSRCLSLERRGASGGTVFPGLGVYLLACVVLFSDAADTRKNEGRRYEERERGERVKEKDEEIGVE